MTYGSVNFKYFMSASCAPARVLSSLEVWRQMANYLRFCGTFSVEVLRFFCLPPCLRTCHGMFEHACSNMACSNMTCSNMFEHDMTCSNMFEHGYGGIHAQHHRYPYGPYGVFKARFLECFGGLESNETRHFLAAPMKCPF